MSEWQPIEALVRDGRQVMFWSPLGGCFIAPAFDDGSPEETRKAHLAVYQETGEWPNAGWNPTHWQPLPPPPEPK